MYVLTNAKGMQAGILTWGGILQFLKVPNKQGVLTDIVLGYDTVAEYESGDAYFGALIGRCGNRIAKGRFTLSGKEYSLYCNNNDNHLHGGKVGFDSRLWAAEVRGNQLILSLTSPDGEEGYPGTLRVSVAHSLDDNGLFTWEYSAHSDKETLCNLTNHTYFNLAGHGSGTILDQQVQLLADAFTVTDGGLIPTGELMPVDGTPMDFRQPHAMGERIQADFEPLLLAGGYDHNYAVQGASGTLRDAAAAWDEISGIRLRMRTTTSGIQLYTGNFLTGVQGKQGAVYPKNSGFCLETQHFPDAIHHPSFEQCVLQPGEEYHQITDMLIDTL